MDDMLGRMAALEHRCARSERGLCVACGVAFAGLLFALLLALAQGGKAETGRSRDFAGGLPSPVGGGIANTAGAREASASGANARLAGGSGAPVSGGPRRVPSRFFDWAGPDLLQKF
jgi:hypothetical protein